MFFSFNQLAMQALLNVKQEASPEEQLPEKYMQNFLSTLSGGWVLSWYFQFFIVQLKLLEVSFVI